MVHFDASVILFVVQSNKVGLLVGLRDCCFEQRLYFVSGTQKTANDDGGERRARESDEERGGPISLTALCFNVVFCSHNMSQFSSEDFNLFYFTSSESLSNFKLVSRPS